MVTLEELCRTADTLEKLAKEGEDAPTTVLNARGEPVANPVLTEARQQRLVYERLRASLRLPDLGENAGPQRRGGARGVYEPHSRWKVR